MVLQRQTEVPVWGNTSPNNKVELTTSWDGKNYQTISGTDGKWEIKVSTPEAGGPYSVSVMDKKGKLSLNNILIGDVWICSGQSNMEMHLNAVHHAEFEIQSADYPDIRLLTIERKRSPVPLTEAPVGKNGWKICSPETAAKFSAVAYFFGRNIHQSQKIPVGLINASFSGTRAEAWMSAEAIKLYPDLAEELKNIESSCEKEKNKASDKIFPTFLYNAMIYPIIPYAMKGVIWYQGEANAYNPKAYYEIFPLLIYDWRTKWGKNFPFYYVQLANYTALQSEPEDSWWAIIRDAQLKTLHLENTGMAISTDLDSTGEIHSKQKQDVGKRLALIARAKTYGEQIIYSGPIYDYYRIEGNKIRIFFKNTEGGLKTKANDFVKGFTIAGVDRRFYWAEAIIEGDEVVVTSTSVSFPVAVRYAWAENPVCNLYNGFELPASPFRTDFW